MAIKAWLILFASFFFFQSWARADVIFTTVFNVIESKKTERLLVLSGADGRIYKMAKTDGTKKLLKSLTGQVVKLSFYDNGREAIITSIDRASSAEVDPQT